MTEVGVCMGSDRNRIHLKPKTTMTEVGVCMGSEAKQDPPKTQDNNDGRGRLYGKRPNRIHLKPKTTMTEVGVCMGTGST